MHHLGVGIANRILCVCFEAKAQVQSGRSPSATESIFSCVAKRKVTKRENHPAWLFERASCPREKALASMPMPAARPVDPDSPPRKGPRVEQRAIVARTFQKSQSTDRHHQLQGWIKLLREYEPSPTPFPPSTPGADRPSILKHPLGEANHMARGDGWSPVEACVASYLTMLALELNGQRYNKTEHAEALMRKLDGRSRGSVEFKHCNISAILLALGYPSINGYKPRSNYQSELLDAVESQLEGNTIIDAAAQAAVERPVIEITV
jgi:hypothetical protein